MLRGNHESIAMTETFTFRQEVLDKYGGDEALYDTFIDCFEGLQLAATINDDYLCMHGGISPELKLVEQINDINRFVEPQLQGMLCDLLWSDPVKDSDSRSVEFMFNQPRECSYKFGLKPVKKLLKENHLLSVIRGHEVQIDGYKFHRWGGKQAFPSLITVFSAPNYCGSYKNKAAVVLLNNGEMKIK
jgi:serine/threonine-protein phosphatase 2B catalytic subunit